MSLGSLVQFPRVQPRVPGGKGHFFRGEHSLETLPKAFAKAETEAPVFEEFWITGSEDEGRRNHQFWEIN